MAGVDYQLKVVYLAGLDNGQRWPDLAIGEAKI